MTNNELKQKIIEYWDTQPCNIKHSASDIGTEKFFIENSEKRYFVEPHIKDFAQFYQYQGKRVLEIGCGMAADGAEFVKHGAEYVGIDVSSESIELAKKRFEVLGLKGNFYNRNATDDLSDLGKFDLVYCFGVLHHYPDIDKIIDNVYNLLNEKAEFKFMLYSKNSWKYAMIQKGLDQYEAQSGCPYAKAYTKQDVYELLKDKFQVERIRQSHCFMYNIPKYKKGVYELEPWFMIMPEEMREAINEYLGWHLLVKATKL